MNETVLTIVFVGVVTGLVSWHVARQKKSSWKGTLVEKKQKTQDDEDSGPSTSYKLIFRTVEGKKKKCSVHSSVYNQWNVGDRAEKISGEWLPSKTEK